MIARDAHVLVVLKVGRRAVGKHIHRPAVDNTEGVCEGLRALDWCAASRLLESTAVRAYRLRIGALADINFVARIA